MSQYVQYPKLTFSTWVIFFFLVFYHKYCLCIVNSNKYMGLEQSNKEWLKDELFTKNNENKNRFYELKHIPASPHSSSISSVSSTESNKDSVSPMVFHGPPKPPRTMAYNPHASLGDIEMSSFKKNLDEILKQIFKSVDGFATQFKSFKPNFYKTLKPDCYVEIEPLCIHSAYDKAENSINSEEKKAFLPLTKLMVNRISNRAIFYNGENECFAVICNGLPKSYIELESETSERDLGSIRFASSITKLEDKYIFFDTKNFVLQFVSGEEKFEILNGRSILASVIWLMKSRLGQLCLPYVQTAVKGNENRNQRKELKIKFTYSNPINYPLNYLSSGTLQCFQHTVYDKAPVIKNNLSVNIPINLKTMPLIHLTEAAIEMVSCLPNKYIDLFIPGAKKSIISKIFNPLTFSGPVFNIAKANKIVENWAKKCPNLMVSSASNNLLMLKQFNFEILSITFFPTKNKARIFGKISKEPFITITPEKSQVQSSKKGSEYSKKILEDYYMLKPVMGYLIISGKKSFNVGDVIEKHAVVPISTSLKGFVQNGKFIFEGCSLTKK